MRFSLIVATCNRTSEMTALLTSLAAQSFADFEVIIIDQNPDDRLAPIERPPTPWPFPLRRLRSARRQSSCARNRGLTLAEGDIVAFPDDDCLYPADLLAKVDRGFTDNARLAVRTGPAASPGGGFGSGRWQTCSGAITDTNVWTCVIEFNLFIRRDVALRIGGFDERLGVGSRFGSAEGNDLVLRAVRAGWLGWYDVSQLAVHPDKCLSDIAVARSYSYGAGLGYALRKHDAPPRVWLSFMVRAMGGCLVSLARGRAMNAIYYWQTLRGRIAGFRAYRADLS